MPHKINQDECLACGQCLPECPVEAIKTDEAEEVYTIDNEICTDCCACEDICPADCIEKI